MPQKEIIGNQIQESTLDFSGADGSTLSGVDADSLQTFTVGVGANQIVQMDGTTKLPAVDGSQLTNLPGGASALLLDGSSTMTGIINTNVGTFNSNVADGASAIAFDFDSSINLITAGAKLLSLTNNNVEKFSIDKDGAVTAVGGVDALTSATTVVDVAAATAPTTGQVLTATSGTAATWQDASGLFTEDVDDNIFGGTGAGANLTAASGLDNFLAGVNAGANLTTNDQNVVVGNDALTTSQATSSWNAILGYQAAQFAHIGTCTAIGWGAIKGVSGDSLRTDNTVAIGSNAGFFANNIANCVFLGNKAGQGALSPRNTGNSNILIGFETGLNISSADSTVAIGIGSMKGTGGSAFTGNDNVAVGYLSLTGCTTTSNSNTVIGSQAAANLTTGSGNLILGFGAGPTTNQSNKLYIDNSQTDTPLIGGDFSANTVTITGALNTTGGVDKLRSATTAVDVAAATAPTVDQVLTATSGTAATWQDAAGGGIFTEDADFNIVGGTGAGASITGGLGIRNFLGGRNAGSSITTGDLNICIGHYAGRRNNTGVNNVAIGAYAMGSGALGAAAANVAIGRNALSAAGGGAQYNVGVGYGAGATLSNGDYNTFLGPQAGKKITTGSSNVCVGLNAGPTTNQSSKLFIDVVESNTPLIGGDFSANTVTITGALTVTGGVDALTSATTVVDVSAATAPTTGQVLTATSSTVATWQDGLFTAPHGGNIIGGAGAGLNLIPASAFQNFLAGDNAGRGITSGDFNVVVGDGASRYISTGANNTAIGRNAMLGVSGSEITGANNVAVGTSALLAAITTANDNVAIGSSAGAAITTGANNTLIGHSAGSKITVDGGNVCLGFNAGPTTNQTNKLYIDNTETNTPLIGGDFTANTVDITGTLTATSVIATNTTGLQWESGRSRITHNDGGGNSQIRFGNEFSTTEIFTADNSGAALIRCDIDAVRSPLILKVSNNATVTSGDTVTWGTELLVAYNALTWGGVNILTVAGGTMTGDIDMNSNDIDNAKTITFIAEVANTGTTQTVNWTAGQKQKTTITAATGMTFTAPAGPSNLTLKIVNGGLGAITWPGTVKWPGGTEPSWTSSGTDIASFYYDGTNYYGMAGLAFA